MSFDPTSYLLEANFFGKGNENILNNYLGDLPFSINAPINTSFYDFYKTDEDKAEDIVLQGGEGGAKKKGKY